MHINDVLLLQLKQGNTISNHWAYNLFSLKIDAEMTVSSKSKLKKLFGYKLD